MKWKKIILLLMLSIVIAFLLYSLIVFVFINPYIHEEYGRLFEVHDLYNQPKENPTIFFIGSSNIREGINSYIIEESLGHPWQAYNLAFSNDMPLQRLVELESIILYKPDYVVIGITYFNLNNNTEPDVDHLVLSKKLMTMESYSSYLLDDNLNKMITQNKLEFHFYKRKYFISSILNRLSFIREITLNFLAQPKSIKHKNDLKNPYIYTDSQSEEVLKKKLASNQEYLLRFKVDDQLNVQKKALFYFVKKLNENNIPIIIINMPIHPLLKEKIDTKTHENYMNFLNQKIIPKTQGYYDFSEEYQDDLFIDLTHLDEEGRKLFSTKVSDIIKEGS